MRLLRSTGILVIAAVASMSSLQAQETEEIANWSAPPFWTAPVKWAKGAQPGAAPLEAEGLQSVAMPFIAVPPCRIADTRGNGFTGQAGGPIVLANTIRTFQVTDPVPGVPTQCGILAGAVAVSFQFTATTMTSAGNLIAWPSGPAPTTSVLNWNANSVAIGSGGVVQISPTGTLNVQINAPIGQAANLIIDVNGFYIVGGLDSQYVNELQANSVTSFMITDGTIVNNDISASAAIADTKLATIATAGKVADSALSATVTKLGSTVEAGEITDILRSVPLPNLTFADCTNLAPLDFTDGSDNGPDFFMASSGARIVFDASFVTDQNTEICSQLIVPPDYASGGEIRALISKAASTGASELLTCKFARNTGSLAAAGTAATAAGVLGATCTPTLPVSLAPGDSLRVNLSITSDGLMNDAISILSLAFRYTAVQ